MHIGFEPEAGEELAEATAYFAEQSAQTAERFLADIARAESMLLQYPHAAPPIRGNFRRLMLSIFPYQLVYRVQGDEIRVYAVAHLKKKPGYWRRRVSW